MNLQFNHDELVQSVIDFAGKKGLNLNNSVVNVTFTAGRSGTGYSANISIEATGVESIADAKAIVDPVEENTTLEAVVEGGNDSETSEEAVEAESLFAN